MYFEADWRKNAKYRMGAWELGYFAGVRTGLVSEGQKERSIRKYLKDKCWSKITV
jgi:hypothetical protein